MSDPHEERRNQQYSEDELINHIQRLADGDTPPTRDELQTDDDAPSAATVQNHFGTWNDAIQAAGLQPRTPGGQTQYSENDIISHIQRLADGDDPPTRREFRADDDTPAAATVRTQFGGWNNAVEAAGFQSRDQGGYTPSQQWSKDDIISHIQRLATGDDPPTQQEFDADTDAPSAGTVQNYFGSWNDAIQAAGFEPPTPGGHTQYSENDIISHIQRLADGDTPPTATECNADDDAPSVPTVTAHFGSWNNAIQAAGLTPRTHGAPKQYSRHDIISHIQRLADGDSPPTTTEFSADDDAPSVPTVIQFFDSWNTAVEAAGCHPNEEGRNPQYSRDKLITHIQRLATGDDPPTQREFDADDDAPSVPTVQNYFQSWNDAIQAAGFEPNQDGRSRQYSRDELISHIQRLADDNTPPTRDELHTDDDAPSAATVQNFFGSWNDAIQAAGFEPRTLGGQTQYSRDELITHIQRLADGDNPPTATEFRADDDTPATATVRTYFGSWNNAVEAAGFQPDSHQYSRDELINWLIAYRAEFGDWPTRSALADCPGPSSTPYQREFGTLTQAFTIAQQEIDNE
jgi:hypothetical protein